MNNLAGTVSMSGNQFDQLIGATDWRMSALGTVDQWPRALRSAVKMIIESRFPMCIAWGSDLSIVYNKAFSAVIGDRHPAALGMRAQEVWAGVWQVVGPLIQKALEAETVYYEDQQLRDEREGRREPAWYTFSYSPLRDDDDTVAGVLCVCTDTTAKVLNQRRQELRIQFEDRLRGMISAEEIMKLSTEMIGRQLHASQAVIGELSADEKQLSVVADWRADGAISLARRRYPVRAFKSQVVSELRIGRTVVIEDTTRFGFTGGTDADGEGLAADISSQASITVPLIRDGKFTAAFAVHSVIPRRWRTDETTLVQEIAGRAWDAIKRARAELAERESERRFRNMASHAPVMMWTTDPTGYCTYLNPAWYQFTGQKESQGLGYGWLDLTHPDDRPRADRAFREANTEQRPFRVEYRLLRHDGTYRWAIDTAAPRFSDDGSYLGYIGSVIDIDELKTVQDALLASNARFRAAIDAVEGVLWTNDAQGRMVGEQPGWHSLTGQSFEEYKDDGWTAAVHPEDIQPTMEAWHRAVAEGSVFMCEHRLRRRDGEWRNYSIRAIPSIGADGNVLEWVGVHTDITELRRNEDNLREVNAGLQIGIRQSMQERDRLWRMSHDVMAVASLNGYFLNLNPAFTTILGWSEQEATSRPFIELTHPDDRGDLLDKVAVLAKGYPLVRYEIRDLHKDGSYRWLSWTIVPEGDLLYGVARDVTLEKQQASALRHAEDALRQAQKMEAVGQLTGGIAHDFNNLLGSMVGNLEIMKLKSSMGNSRDVDKYIDGAMAAADRAAALTHRLLAFSRRQTLDPKPIDVNVLVSSMTELIQRTVGPSVEIDTRLDNALWATRCDANQLESALLNLAINARDAMSDGGRLLIETGNVHIVDRHAEYDVTVRSLPGLEQGDYVTLTVTDTGTGMTPEVLGRVFDPFFTTKPLGQGTGLGLSMIYGFIKQSGGHIQIDSSPGKGTAVTLMLPRHIGTGVANTSEESTTAPAQAAATATLLLVDDEISLRVLLAEMLTMLGYHTVQATTGPEALNIIRSGVKVDLLISDVGLPGGMNGRQLADAIQKERSCLKTLFITGYSEDVATRSGMLEPGMEIITKPFAMDVFAARVHGMLNGTSLRQHARLG